jgi:predicted nucleotidyltransferase
VRPERMEGYMEVFTPDEMRMAARKVAEAIRPLGLRTMVLGRLAILLLFDVGGTSKDVDLHPFPIDEVELEQVFDRLQETVEAEGGHLRLEPDGKSMTLFTVVDDRTVPVELIFGGEDWISPEVLADAVRTGSERGGLYVPSSEHLFTMKAEAAIDRRVGDVALKSRADMVQISFEAQRTRRPLDPVEVRRLVRMRPGRKRARMLALCEDVLDQLVQGSSHR